MTSVANKQTKNYKKRKAKYAGFNRLVGAASSERLLKVFKTIKLSCDVVAPTILGFILPYFAICVFNKHDYCKFKKLNAYKSILCNTLKDVHRTRT